MKSYNGVSTKSYKSYKSETFSQKLVNFFPSLNKKIKIWEFSSKTIQNFKKVGRVVGLE